MRDNKKRKNNRHLVKPDPKPKNNYWLLAIAAVAIIGAAIYFLRGNNTETPVNGYEGEVASVVNGNTIKLTNGLTVRLLGVFPDSKSEQFLKENIVGKRVKLTSDSNNLNATFKLAEQSTVDAYVLVLGNVSFSALNGHILRNKLSTFNDANVKDSLDVWRAIGDGPKPIPDTPGCPPPGPELSLTELSKKMKAASFVITTKSSMGTAIGTGFFINERGLALTNFHVEDMGYSMEDLLILLCDEEGKFIDTDAKGNIQPKQARKVGRVLDSNEKYDFSIFTVVPDQGETFKCLPIARNRPVSGIKVGVVGNPVGLVATFSDGIISALREDIGMIQTTASMTHGNSGGPICDTHGEVVGIAKSVLADQDGKQNSANLNFGVDIMLVREALGKLKVDIAQEYAGK